MHAQEHDKYRFLKLAGFLGAIAGLVPGAQALEPGTLRDPLQPESIPDVESRETLFQVGPVHFHPRAAASVVYDDNIFINNRNREDDVIWAFQPGLTLAAGQYPTFYEPVPVERYISLDYAPTFYVFSENDDQNAIDHRLELRSQYTWTKLAVGLSHVYQALSGNEADIGGRVNRDVFTTRLKTHYQMTEKTSFDINGSHIVRDYRNQIDSTEYINDNWLNYHVRPKITVGLGAIFGWVDVDDFPDQTYQQIRIRTTYHLTAKVDLNASGGVEFRQFEGDRDDRVGLRGDLGFRYIPRESTIISSRAYRRDQNSSLIGRANYVATGVAAGIQQRFLQRYWLSVTGGFENSDYYSTTPGVAIDREDDYFFIRTGVDWNITKRWAAGVFYYHRENDSSGANARFDFDNNQYGLHTSVRF